MRLPDDEASEAANLAHLRATETPAVVRYAEELFRKRRELTAQLADTRRLGFLRVNRSIPMGMSVYVVAAFLLLVACALVRYSYLHPKP